MVCGLLLVHLGRIRGFVSKGVVGMGGVFAQVCKCARLDHKGTSHLKCHRRRQIAFFVAAILLAGLSGVGWTQRRSLAGLVIHNSRSDAHFLSPSHSRPQLAAAYGRLPLSFEVNAGQTDARARFVARGRGYSLFLTDSEAVLALKSSAAGNDPFQKASESRSGEAVAYACA